MTRWPSWSTSGRRRSAGAGIDRTYSATDVVNLRGSVVEEHTLARLGAEKLWNLIQTTKFTRALGALTGNQAVQMVRGGLESIYLSGWQVAADANLSGQTYPDQSLYPANSVPAVVRRINNALMRADQIDHSSGKADIDFLVPIVADAEAGFGGPLNAFELMKSMIVSGAAGVHWEDQLASEKKCGHLGGKVLIPDGPAHPHPERGTAGSRYPRCANPCHRPYRCAGGRPADQRRRPDRRPLHHRGANQRGILPGAQRDRAGAGAGEGLRPVLRHDLGRDRHARPRAGAGSSPRELHREFPGKKLAYNCSPSFNWKAALSDSEIAGFQDELGDLGYAFQFITLAGFHAVNHSMFHLANGYAQHGMSAYVELQEAEFAAEGDGYTAIKHQAEVGTGYFDKVSTAINPTSGTLALAGSTEAQQFH